jgi:hypothetical protein
MSRSRYSAGPKRFTNAATSEENCAASLRDLYLISRNPCDPDDQAESGSMLGNSRSRCARVACWCTSNSVPLPSLPSSFGYDAVRRVEPANGNTAFKGRESSENRDVGHRCALALEGLYCRQKPKQLLKWEAAWRTITNNYIVSFKLFIEYRRVTKSIARRAPSATIQPYSEWWAAPCPPEMQAYLLAFIWFSLHFLAGSSRAKLYQPGFRR